MKLAMTLVIAEVALIVSVLVGTWLVDLVFDHRRKQNDRS